MTNPSALDKGCTATTEIVGALYVLEHPATDVYLRGIRHVQLEGAFGPPVDNAAQLRGRCAMGLVTTHYADALYEVVALLVDSETEARMGAARALGCAGGEAAVLALRLKILTGDADPEVLGECFSGLVLCDAERSLGFIAQYMDDQDDAVAEAAILALGGSRLPRGSQELKNSFPRMQCATRES